MTVTVANLEETGTLTFVGEVTQGANGVLLQATLTDPDVVATETWVWQRRTGRSGPWMDIANTNASYTPSAADVGQYLRASVTYTDGAGTNETTLTKATDLRTVNDASVNQPPDAARPASPGRRYPGERQHRTECRASGVHRPGGRAADLLARGLG